MAGSVGADAAAPIPMQSNVNSGNSRGGNNTQTQQTTYCIYANYNYFSSCEGHTHDDHTGAT